MEETEEKRVELPINVVYLWLGLCGLLLLLLSAERLFFGLRAIAGPLFLGGAALSVLHVTYICEYWKGRRVLEIAKNCLVLVIFLLLAALTYFPFFAQLLGEGGMLPYPTRMPSDFT